MDVALAVGRGDAYRHVLDRAAEAAHRMTLEVREDDSEVVVGIVRADDVIGEVFAALDRKSDFALGIHDVDRGDGCETVFFGCAAVVFGGEAATFVSGVTLDDCAVGESD